jgi:hypothetical protein
MMVFHLLTGLVASQAQSPLPAPPPSPAAPACVAPEHRQFDFWVGSWIVYPTGKEQAVGRSLIEKLYGGCAIRENWMPFKGGAGGSLNNYVSESGRWHQTWLDSNNARVEFSGGMQGSAMVLTGFWKDVNGPGQSGLVRMTYTRDAAGSVRQLGEFSGDEGKSWSPAFDFTYKPAPAP